ncbi:hypothetical protein H0H81_010722 [Sphagnurus paluster]|uniref:Uncharacterized protein n=1 Tax=Sphagnurus paluster TaxID=117069 RepID=A0A9P7GPY0_9AGAR|nr:hypothetical protein H0H81_010722 [Sphagnurus paluster]
MASRNFYAAIALLVFNIFLQSVLWIQRLLPSARLRVLNDLMESTRLSSQELQQESSYRCQELDSFHALEKEVEALKHRTFIELAHHKELCCLLRGVSYEIWTMGRRVKRLHARLVVRQLLHVYIMKLL